MTPRQISRALAKQTAHGELDASLRRLFGELGEGMTGEALRRIVVQIRRDICRVIAKAIHKIDKSAERALHIVEERYVIGVFGRKQVVHLVLSFVFFISVGYVHMVEPSVQHRLI